MNDGLNDLKGYVRRFLATQLDVVSPLPELFAEWDQHWMEWNPKVDALKIASVMLNDERFPSAPAKIAQRYYWIARRLNPALTYLYRRGAIEMLTGIGSAPYLSIRVLATEETRRFVRSRQHLKI